MDGQELRLEISAVQRNARTFNARYGCRDIKISRYDNTSVIHPRYDIYCEIKKKDKDLGKGAVAVY